MTVLLDTNVIMDALQERQPFDVEAEDKYYVFTRFALNNSKH